LRKKLNKSKKITKLAFFLFLTVEKKITKSRPGKSGDERGGFSLSQQIAREVDAVS
jgi:hypothetical protein